MGTILLTWNPDYEGPDTYELSDQWPDVIEATTRGDRWTGLNWSVGQRRHGIGHGDTAYFLLQGKGPRGIVAQASVTSVIQRTSSWRNDGSVGNYVNVDIVSAVDVEDRIPTELLRALVPEVKWNSLYSSGRSVSDDAARRLADLWADHVNGPVIPAPEEESEFVEGAVTQVLVNRYERDPAARRACLDHYGERCVACGRDFIAEFGKLGHGLIVVHHLTPLSDLKGKHVVDPIADMRPLCPNCHAMVHSKKPPLHPNALRKRLTSIKAKGQA